MPIPIDAGPTGTKVWVTAQFIGTTGRPGPAAEPVQAYLNRPTTLSPPLFAAA